jgi:ketosteroid isomerase-like protein
VPTSGAEYLRTVSEQNVTIVRRILGEWAEGDFGAAVDRFDPDLVFTTFMPDSREDVVAHGLAELQAFTRDWFQQWEGYRIFAEEFATLDEERVMVRVRQTATGRHSGVAVDSPGFTVWTLRGGRVRALALHYDRDKALAAAGLGPDSSRPRETAS